MTGQRRSTFARTRLRYALFPHLCTPTASEYCCPPLQKEPKLDRARQIPEWEIYDNEIAAFARTLQDKPQSGETEKGAEGAEKAAEHTRDEL